MMGSILSQLRWLEALVASRRHTSGCLFFTLVMLPFLVTFWIMQMWALLSPAAGTFYQDAPLRSLQMTLTLALMFLGWVILFTWRRRRSIRPRPRLVLATTLSVAATMMILSIGYGLKDTPMGLVMLSLLIIGRTLFTTAELRPAMWFCGVLFFINEVLLVLGKIPYAPALTAPVFDGGPMAWWWDLWLRVIFNQAIIFFCAMLFFLFWVKERRQAKLENLARVDALTGLLNRTTFMRMFEEECSKQRRSHRPACVLMCDVDHFKKVNDTYGHPAGDLVLMRIGHLLKSSTRYPVDVPARFGGEEFVVLLPETDLCAAQRVAERISEQLRGQTFEIDGQKFSVTLSIGVAQSADGDGADALRRADANLYTAKNQGRNRVVTSGQ